MGRRVGGGEEGRGWGGGWGVGRRVGCFANKLLHRYVDLMKVSFSLSFLILSLVFLFLSSVSPFLS